MKMTTRGTVNDHESYISAKHLIQLESAEMQANTLKSRLMRSSPRCLEVSVRSTSQFPIQKLIQQILCYQRLIPWARSSYQRLAISEYERPYRSLCTTWHLRAATGGSQKARCTNPVLGTKSDGNSQVEELLRQKSLLVPNKKKNKTDRT